METILPTTTAAVPARTSIPDQRQALFDAATNGNSHINGSGNGALPPTRTRSSPALATSRAALHAQVDAHRAAGLQTRLPSNETLSLLARFTPPADERGLHGNLDQQMAAISKQFQAIFRQEVGPEVYRQAEPVLALLQDRGASFADRRQAVDAFVDRYKETNPVAITDLIKMIDCQLTVYGAVEDHAQIASARPQVTLDESVHLLADQCGNDPHAIAARLANMTVAPVLTAHPTSLHDPQSVMHLHDAVTGLQDPASLRRAFVELWADSGARRQRPSVRTEAELNLPQLERMQREIKRIHKDIDRAISPDNSTPQIKPLVRSESWIGGDRDGNALVDAITMKDIMALQADAALSRYAKKLGPEREVKPGSLRSLLDLHAPGEAARIGSRLAATKAVLGQRNGTNGVDRLDAYLTPQALIEDLDTLRSTLPAGAPQEKLARFIREIGGAGFHTAAVDVRQNSAAHAVSVAELLAAAGIEADYANLPEADKQALLCRQLMAGPDSSLIRTGTQYSAQTAKELEIFQAIRDIHDSYGQAAMPNYIVANTETVSDLLEPMLLLKQVGLAGPDGLKLKIIPLIETVPDLKNGRQIVGDLLANPQYRDWLQRGDNTQQVMVGYSDSNRLDGPLASNWEIEKALHYLQEVTEDHGVNLLVFHGRGGTVARGAGADPQQEVAMMPDGAGLRGYRFTDQGERIGHKYGTNEAAEHHLRSTTAASIAASIPRRPPEDPAFHAAMEDLSNRSSEAYRELVFQNPRLIDFYNDATPVRYTPHLNAGSRSASRAGPADQRVNLGQLRAIPWVAGWTQQRAMLPAYLGLGTATDAYLRSNPDQHVDRDKLAQLRTMYKEWPFFTHFIDRTEGELAKVSLPIVRQYAGLVNDQTTAQEIYAEIATEFTLASNAVMAIKQKNRLLEDQPAQRENLARRAPALDTANALQIKLIDVQRNTSDPDLKARLTKGVVGTMQAVQSGLGRFG